MPRPTSNQSRSAPTRRAPSTDWARQAALLGHPAAAPVAIDAGGGEVAGPVGKRAGLGQRPDQAVQRRAALRARAAAVTSRAWVAAPGASATAACRSARSTGPHAVGGDRPAAGLRSRIAWRRPPSPFGRQPAGPAPVRRSRSRRGRAASARLQQGLRSPRGRRRRGRGGRRAKATLALQQADLVAAVVGGPLVLQGVEVLGLHRG